MRPCEGCGRNVAPLLRSIYYVGTSTALASSRVGDVKLTSNDGRRTTTLGWSYLRRFCLDMCADCWSHPNAALQARARVAYEREGFKVPESVPVDLALVTGQAKLHYKELVAKASPVLMRSIVHDDFDYAGRTTYVTVTWKGKTLAQPPLMLAVDGVIEVAAKMSKGFVIQLPLKPGEHELGFVHGGRTNFNSGLYSAAVKFAAQEGMPAVFELRLGAVRWEFAQLTAAPAPQGWPGVR
jgi:hypothetical protein